MRSKRSPHQGIEVRHSRSCSSRAEGECNCKPSYQASAWSRRDRKRIRKTFPTLAAAKAWRQDAQVALRRGTMRPPSKRTLDEAADTWLRGIGDGEIRNRSGDQYKPSVRRGYESALRLHILPELGVLRISEVARNDVQDLADRLLAEGLDPSTVRNALMPLRALYRRAVARSEVAINPTSGIELPAVRGKRDRIASPKEASQLLAALPAEDRALWATALYAGLRLGELQALRLDDVDLSGGIIRVERSWDPKEGAIEPKSSAGRRTVPVAAALRDELLEHWVRSGRQTGLLFGRTTTSAFLSATVTNRARRVWKHAGLEPIGLHECRHTFASLMIAAGVNAKALSTYLGHSSIQITLDRYGHLMPGNEVEAASLLDSYLERATAARR